MPVQSPNMNYTLTFCDNRRTFQELVMSKRLLLVSEVGLMFQCDTSECSESHPEERLSDMGSGLGTIDLRHNGADLLETGKILDLYTSMVQEYSKRELTYQDDIEKAFAGLSSVLEGWCVGCPSIHGMMSRYFGFSMIWVFHEAIDRAVTGRTVGQCERRYGSPSWSWVGWGESTLTMCGDLNVQMPFQSAISNVEVTIHDQRAAPMSFDIIDKSIESSTSNSAGQRIRVNMNPAGSLTDSRHPSTLAFVTERTELNNFTTVFPSPSGFWTLFRLRGNSPICGYLSIVPNEEVCSNVLRHTADPKLEIESSLSLIQLYHVRQKLRFSEVFDLNLDVDYPSEFITRFEESSLLYVLLIRRHGKNWERVGSGFMIRRFWPSTRARAKLRAYEEKIVLI